MKLYILCFVIIALGGVAHGNTGGQTQPQFKNCPEMMSLVKTILDHQQMQTDPTKSGLSAALADSISEQKVTLMKENGWTDEQIDEYLSEHISQLPSDSSLKAPAPAAVPKAEPVNSRLVALTPGELSFVNTAINFGQSKGLNATKALLVAIRESNHDAVKGFVVGSRRWEDVCASLGNRCYYLAQDFNRVEQGEKLTVYMIKRMNRTDILNLMYNASTPPTEADMVNLALVPNMFPVVKTLLEQMPQFLNAKDGDRTIMSVAVESKNLPLADYLISRGYQVDAHEFFMLIKDPALEPAAQAALAKNPALHKNLGSKNVTVLAIAASYGNSKLIPALLAAGVDVNEGPDSKKPIDVAIENNEKEAVSVLINARAELNPTTGTRPLLSAIKKYDIALIKLLVYGGAVVTDEDVKEAERIYSLPTTSDQAPLNFVRQNR